MCNVQLWPGWQGQTGRLSAAQLLRTGLKGEAGTWIYFCSNIIISLCLFFTFWRKIRWEMTWNADERTQTRTQRRKQGSIWSCDINVLQEKSNEFPTDVRLHFMKLWGALRLKSLWCAATSELFSLLLLPVSGERKGSRTFLCKTWCHLHFPSNQDLFLIRRFTPYMASELQCKIVVICVLLITSLLSR